MCPIFFVDLQSSIAWPDEIVRRDFSRNCYKEVKGSDKISEIRVDTYVVVNILLEVEYVAFVHTGIEFLDRHLRVEELIELHVALSIMLDSSFS